MGVVVVLAAVALLPSLLPTSTYIPQENDTPYTLAAKKAGSTIAAVLTTAHVLEERREWQYKQF